MPVPIAELFVSVSADVSGALSGLQAVDRQLNSSKNSFDAARPAALAFAASGAAIGAGFAKSLSTAASFDAAMSGVQAQLSTDEVQQFGGALDKLALQLGQQTTFTARQAAAGIEEMLKAGISVEDVLGGAGQAALDLASATGVSVAEAGVLAAKAMTAFGVSAKDLPGVVNTLAGVTVTTAADMTSLSQGLSDVGSVAAGFGASFEDTAVVLGVFNQAGLSSQTAGTALKVMLQRLQPTTKKNVDEFKKLGFITAEGNNVFFDAQGHIKNYAAVAGTLRQALSGMTDEQRQATLTQLFGTEAVQAANILYAQGAAGINNYTAAARKINAGQVAGTRRNNLTGDIEQLTGALEIAQIVIGRLFTPAARNAVQQVTKLVQAFNGLAPATQRNLVFFAGIAGAALFLVGSFVLLAPFIAALPVAFAAMATVLAALTPLFVVLAAVTAVLVTAWRRDLFGIQEIVKSAFQNLPAQIDATKTKLDELRDAFSGRVNEGVQLFKDTIVGLTPAIADARDRLQELNDKLDPIAAKADSAQQKLLLVATAMGLISTSTPGAASGLGAVNIPFTDLTVNVGLLGPAITLLSIALRGLPLLLGVLGGPVTIAAIAIGVLAGAFFFAYQNNQQFRDGVDGLIGQLGTLGDSIGGAFGGLVTLAQTDGPQILAFFQKFGDDVLGFLIRQKDSLKPFTDSLGNLFNSLVNLMGALGQTGTQVMKQLFDDVLIPGFTALKGIMQQLQPLLQPFLDFLGRVFANFDLGKTLQPVTDFINSIALVFNTIADFLKNNPLQGGTVKQLFDILTPAPFKTAGAIGNAQLANTATVPTGGAQGGVNVNFNAPVSINGAGEFETFLARVTNAVADAAGRVVVPPDNSSHPTLLPSVT